MSIDLSQQTGALRRKADVCVIGAGAAGITTARRLLAAGHDVLLLESGGLDYERETADLNAGRNVGQAYYDLDDARLRFFGGTTAIWGGRCATLDPIDLQRRDWVAGSGWPLSWRELQDYYDQARGIFEIGDEPASAAALSAHGVPLPGFDTSELHMPVWNFDPRFNRFTFDVCQDLRDHPRCEIITHASVTRIVTKDGAIHRIEAKALAGAHLHVEARAFVLAAGGIENARLLLASNVGNERDQVGRNFMEHPHARGGRIVDARAWPLLKAFGRRHRIGGHDMAALITPSADLQRREGLLNSSLTIVGRQPASASQFWGMRAYGSLKHDMSPTRGGRQLWMMTKKAATWAQRHVDPLRPWLLHKAGKLEIALLVRAEQAPNPDSRVLLTRERDALGVPRVALDWRLSAIDKHSVTGLVDGLGRELDRLNMGRVERADWLDEPGELWRNDPLISSHAIGGYHHMGTTRMANDPRQGVVDADGRVHGQANLYVVGSSTFPTSSWANPTLTIAALALRTADRLSVALNRPVADARPLERGLAQAS